MQDLVNQMARSLIVLANGDCVVEDVENAVKVSP